MISLEEYMEKASEIHAGYIVAALTDAYIVDEWPMKACSLVGKEDQVLEIRIFNLERELKLIRTDIFSEYHFRDSLELDERGLDSYIEKQYLDIDTTKCKDSQGRVTSTGGGKYYLPLKMIDDAYLELKIYLSKYESSGQVRVYDWRMMDLKEGK